MFRSLVKRRYHALILATYAAVGLLLVPVICQRLPYSWYYLTDSDQDYKVILDENSQRVKAAISLLNGLNHTAVYRSISSQSRTEPDFCFIINTVTRPVSTMYLTQVVSSLLPQVLNDERTILAVNNAEGATHKEAMSLADVVPVISNKKVRNSRSNYDKARQDYLFALRWCHSRKAKFTVVFEDDALPYHDFIFRLRFILNHRMRGKENTWAILKLFYPEKYQGWGNEFHLIAELLLLSAAGGLLLTVLVYHSERLVGRSKQFSWLMLTVSTLFTMYVLLSMGRPHWIAVRKISVHLSSVVTAPGCCIPVSVYPHSHMNDLIDYLDRVKCNSLFPIDLALDSFADTKNLQKLLVVPNLVKHIGYVSSIPGKGWKNSKEFRVK